MRLDRTELLSGLLILGVGTYFFLGAQEYRMGTMQRMGPGFIPYWLGLIEMTLGALILISGVNRSSELPRVDPRVVIAVLGAIAAFALLLPRVGLVAATFVVSITAMLGDRQARWPLMLITAATISLICWVLFILLLGLPIPDFRLRF
ncbi:tripartite tricarboxylate transporter TctB family protein [Plastorhodobacter daqingensis]|uniref:Tripartite tricarboxylate transporter TctB family protein n=1 Tax=Plastorhodobacter daqingensis TaxID=1387281 RepID=A0ABW2UQB7_9RHOB